MKHYSKRAISKEKRREASELTGSKIKELREARGWIQDRLADEVGVKKQHISQWEHGKSLPTKPNLLLLGKVFDYDFYTPVADEFEFTRNAISDVYAAQGQNLRAARKDRRLSQDKASKIIGVAPSTLCQWEQGVAKVSDTYKAVVERFYDLPSGSLL